jgi:DNA-binding GntR family transcriptional regulator
MKLCLERLVPRRGRSVTVALPAIETAADIAPAMAAIAQATAQGAITPYDGAELSRMVESCVRAMELGDFERRLREVEASVAPRT